MGRQRNSVRSVLLSDELSRARPAASQSFANAAHEVAAKKAQKKKLGTAFHCPICKRGESVECRIDARRNAGEASCSAGGCGASYSGAADALTEPIDVHIHCAWIDERERSQRPTRSYDMGSYASI